MNLEELQKVLNKGEKEFIEPFYIFINSESSFLSNQYINKIAEIKGCSIEYIENPLGLLSNSMDIFGDSENNNTLYINKVDEFNYTDIEIKNIENLIIVADSVNNDCIELFKDLCSIIEMPKLVDWQIRDYAYSTLPNLENSKLDWLLSKCGKNIFRLDNEISRLSVFTKGVQNKVFDDFVNNGVYNDLSNFVVYDLTNAILTKKISTIVDILQEVKNFDCEPLGVNTLLLNSFKNVIKIQLSKNPTAESLDMKSGQFYAIKKNNCGFYSKEQLITIYNHLQDCELKLKTGELTNDELLDYMILGVLTA